MKKQEEDLTKMSIEELNKKLKSSKMIAGFFVAAVAVQLLCGIYLTIKDGFNAFTVLPVAFLPILLINFNSLKKIKAEIARR